MTELEKLSKVYHRLKSDGIVQSQADFGQQLGYSSNTYVSEVFSGSKPLSKKFKSKVENTFNINPDFWKDDTVPIFRSEPTLKEYEEKYERSNTALGRLVDKIYEYIGYRVSSTTLDELSPEEKQLIKELSDSIKHVKPDNKKDSENQGGKHP